MRTPSIYSQDDPISAALKPSATETEAERTARLYAEAEAKKVSEQIDEHLRDERERLKKRKGDVKVCFFKRNVRIYSLTSLAIAPGASGKREVYTSETIPAYVQAPLAGKGAVIVANCDIF
jgi:hypothetical protein